jgi:hypothetical protein
MSAVKWGIGIFLLLVASILLYLCFRAFYVNYSPGVSIKTQGGNATTQNEVKYTCPVGQVIKFSDNPPPTIIDNSGIIDCNPYIEDPSSSNPFNAATTQTATDLISKCTGKQTCSYKLADNIILGNGPTECGGINAQIIATYGCVSEST